ncbi:hypothetical protein [Dactylosporangium maewongense]
MNKTIRYALRNAGTPERRNAGTTLRLCAGIATLTAGGAVMAWFGVL